MDIDGLRDQVRAHIQDTGVPAAESLSDNELDQALNRAAKRYSADHQRERNTALTTGAATTREVDISTLIDLYDIIGAEIPTGDYPKRWAPFSMRILRGSRQIWSRPGSLRMTRLFAPRMNVSGLTCAGE